MSGVDALFEEFVSRWTQGEDVDPAALLERAGPGADELAGLIDAFLARAPRRAATEHSTEAIAAIAARLEHDPPLLSARLAARKRVREVTAAIRELCGLPPASEELVRSYYQRLEGGLLDPSGVSERVWAVLDRIVAPTARKLAVDGFRPLRAAPRAPAFRRAASAGFTIAAPMQAEVAPAPQGKPAEPDFRQQVDALFTGGDVH